MRSKEPILSFTGKYRWLSNFWPVSIVYSDLLYPSVEHAYQASKTRSFAFQNLIASFNSPAEAKREGRSLTLRDDWDSIRFSVMHDLVEAKFKVPYLAERLLRTNDALLVEGNTWGDRYWGMCGGTGANNLGRILMKVRQCLGRHL